MTRKQTSAKVSKLAARLVKVTAHEIEELTATDTAIDAFAKDIRTLAASCLSQDEVKGSKPTVFKATKKFTRPTSEPFDPKLDEVGGPLRYDEPKKAKP